MHDNYYSQKPCRSELKWKRARDGAIIIRTDSNQLIGLAPFGMDIYEKCSGKTTILEITQYLQKKYPHISIYQIEDEIYRFLHFLQSVGVLVICTDDF